MAAERAAASGLEMFMLEVVWDKIEFSPSDGSAPWIAEVDDFSLAQENTKITVTNITKEYEMKGAWTGVFASEHGEVSLDGEIMFSCYPMLRGQFKLGDKSGTFTGSNKEDPADWAQSGRR
eukprot:TRINITY_DN10955_c0_g1_i1.p1 TRINITY_DN10955_c0_g1~~TRINITY_DN10955_c0_g1_i1.p1  ORF type:complete len:121 (+),score=31.74 TRINITY_DN10955_c0_g1_i1:129-491(+)